MEEERRKTSWRWNAMVRKLTYGDSKVEGTEIKTKQLEILFLSGDTIPPRAFVDEKKRQN